MAMIDFDGLFSKFMRKWLERNENKFPTAEALEDTAAEIYEEWCSQPEKALGGIAPKDYFARIDDAEQLVKMFGEYIDSTGDVPNLLLDRLAECKGCEQQLIEIVKEGAAACGAKTMYAMNLLNELQSEKALEVFADIIFDDNTVCGETAELASEIMGAYPHESAALIISRLDGASPKSKELAADVLSNCAVDERIFALLSEMFLSGINYELYAGYLGKYGDSRAVGILKEAAATCDYVSFVEITNAVESLGGDMDDVERDFSDDPYFRKLKNSAKSG